MLYKKISQVALINEITVIGYTIGIVPQTIEISSQKALSADAP